MVRITPCFRNYCCLFTFEFSYFRREEERGQTWTTWERVQSKLDLFFLTKYCFRPLLRNSQVFLLRFLQVLLFIIFSKELIHKHFLVLQEEQQKAEEEQEAKAEEVKVKMEAEEAELFYGMSPEELSPEDRLLKERNFGDRAMSPLPHPHFESERWRRHHYEVKVLFLLK